MKNRKLLVKIVFIVLILLLLLSLIVPVIFSQTAPRKETLLNGLKVLTWSDLKADRVAVKIRIHSGSAFDPQGKEGVMQMLSDNLFPNEASREFFAEDLGGGLEVVATYDYIQVNASAKPDQFLTMLETLASALSNPPIDKENTARLRNVLIAKVKTLESDPAYVADQAVAKRLFGTFPYGRPQLGTEASLQKIEYADLVEARQRFLTADNGTIAVSGNFDRSLALRAIKRYFGGWLKADKKVPSTFRQPDEPEPSVLAIELVGLQRTYSRWARNAPSRSDPDYYAMQILASIRREQRCTDAGRYEAHHVRGAYISGYDRPIGETLIYSGPCPVNGSSDGKVVLAEIQSEEFNRAKTTFVSRLQQQFSSPDALANLWLDIDTYALRSPEDEMRKLLSATAAGVKLVGERVLNSRVAHIVVTNPSKSN